MSFSPIKKFEKKGKPATVSLDRVCGEQTVTLVIDQKYVQNLSPIKSIRKSRRARHPTFHNFAIDLDDLSFLSSTFKNKIFHKRRCASVELLRGKKLAMDWIEISEEDLAKYGGLAGDLVALENPNLIGINVGYPLSKILLNLCNPIIDWLMTIKDSCEKERNGLRPDQFQKTLNLLKHAIGYYQEYANRAKCYLKGWQETAGLPSELKPPSTDIEEEMILDIETFYNRGRIKYPAKPVLNALSSRQGLKANRTVVHHSRRS